jgi:hypothetical protein
MIPATANDLENILLDFNNFVKLGNGAMKAAWLAASGRGFADIIVSNKNHTLLMRDTDKKFIVFTYIIETNQPEAVESKSIVKFHIDESCFKGGDNEKEKAAKVPDV